MLSLDFSFSRIKLESCGSFRELIEKFHFRKDDNPRDKCLIDDLVRRDVLDQKPGLAA